MAIRSGELSPTEHVGDVLDRLAADPYNLVVTLDAERALAQAAALTEELAQGRWRGPLHGVALGVKDLFDVAGLPTRCGSALFADAAPAVDDAAAAAPPRGAAVAAGYVPLALGTDRGCGVRPPAAHCGVVGLKPAFGHVSTAGVFPLAESLDHVGLLTGDAHSAAVAWDVLDRADGTGGGIPTPGVAGVRVGVPADDYWRPVDPVIADGVAAAITALEKAGAQIVEVRTPMIEELATAYPVIVGNEAYATHASWLAERPDDYQPLIRERLLSFAGRPAKDYIDAQRLRRRLVPEFRAAVEGVDVLVTATTRLRATPIGQAEVDGVQVRPALLALNLPFNLSGWPAVSVPAPMDTPDGLPV